MYVCIFYIIKDTMYQNYRDKRSSSILRYYTYDSYKFGEDITHYSNKQNCFTKYTLLQDHSNQITLRLRSLGELTSAFLT